MTIPSGTLNDKGCGSGRKKADFLDKAVRLRRSAVRIAVWGCTPVAVRLVRTQTTRPVLRVRPKVPKGSSPGVIRGFLCTGWLPPVGKGQEHVSRSSEPAIPACAFPV